METWVEVAAHGNPDQGSRGLVYCRLCRKFKKSNLLAKGYRCFFIVLCVVRECAVR